MFHSGRSSRSTRRSAVVLTLLTSAFFLAQAQSPYSGNENTVVLEAYGTTLDIRAAPNPYSDDVYIRALVLDGPFAGAQLVGILTGTAEPRLDPAARLFATLDRGSGTVRLTAVVPNDGGTAVRLTGSVRRSQLDRRMLAADWPDVVPSIWPVQGR